MKIIKIASRPAYYFGMIKTSKIHHRFQHFHWSCMQITCQGIGHYRFQHFSLILHANYLSGHRALQISTFFTDPACKTACITASRTLVPFHELFVYLNSKGVFFIYFTSHWILLGIFTSNMVRLKCLSSNGLVWMGF